MEQLYEGSGSDNKPRKEAAVLCHCALIKSLLFMQMIIVPDSVSLSIKRKWSAIHYPSRNVTWRGTSVCKGYVFKHICVNSVYSTSSLNTDDLPYVAVFKFSGG